MRDEKSLTSGRFVRWCNGNTALFGGVIHGSNPCRTATICKELEVIEIPCTSFAQIPKLPRHEVKFPVEIEFKDQRAKIYRPAKSFAFYRISFRTAGKRRMLTFGTYGEAKKAAEEKVRELHNGQQSAGLTAKQSQDAIVALQRLVELTHATGRKVSLLSAVSEFAEASSLLKGRSLIETAQTFLQSIASVKRKDISEAVEEFIIGREAKTKAATGQRGTTF